MSVVETERTGYIKEFYDLDTGLIIEDHTSGEFEFAQQGAQVVLDINDKVIFITVTTPSGKIITKNILKKNH